MNSVKTLIFDCDGVLIDSEIVVCRLVAETFTRLGHPLAVEDVIRRFAGRPESDMIVEIERDWGRPVPPDYFDAIRASTAEAYATELRALPNAIEVLQRLRLPICVASSSHPEKLRLGLESVGLFERFAPNIVSTAYVAQGKPAPDVFVYAAGWMRTPIAECLVIEDSLPGVRAAKAAGLRVVGFTGGGHCGPEHRDRLLDAGAECVLADFRALEILLPHAFATESDPGPPAS